MDYCDKDKHGSDQSITISRALYDSYVSGDTIALIIDAYLEKIKKGEMELDFKVIDLIHEGYS